MEGGYSFQPLTDEENAIFRKHFIGEDPDANLVKIVDSNNDYILTVKERFKEVSHFFTSLKLREDDVWIITSPKCGTTWTQETTWHIMNNVQLQRTQERLFDRSPFLEMGVMRSSDPNAAEEMIRKLDDLPSPRTIKTHLPLELLPPTLLATCKVIFVNRNIKDACVSMYYHLLRRKTDFDSKFVDFAKEVFRAGMWFQVQVILQC